MGQTERSLNPYAMSAVLLNAEQFSEIADIASSMSALSRWADKLPNDREPLTGRGCVKTLTNCLNHDFGPQPKFRPQ